MIYTYVIIAFILGVALSTAVYILLNNAHAVAEKFYALVLATSKKSSAANKFIIAFDGFLSRHIEPPYNKRLVALVQTNNSGSNTLALAKYAPDWIKAKYDIRVVKYRYPLDFSTYKLFRDARAIFQTHEYEYFASNRYQLGMQLWHGFPMKSAGLMSNRSGLKYRYGMLRRLQAIYDNSDRLYFSSSSPMFETVVNSSFPVGKNQFVLTGNPRNDFLLRADRNHPFFEQKMGISPEQKIVYFVPTWRRTYKSKKRVDGNKSMTNIFGMPQEGFEAFMAFLAENNITIVAKLHPYEEAFYLKALRGQTIPNFVLLTDAMLESGGVDLYELLGSGDALITDYSSIYFDFLLVDKPVIFTPVDLEDYGDSLGFVLNPYEDWTPGPKAVTFEALQAAITAGIERPGEFSEERRRVARIAHSHDDARSTERVWQWMDQKLANWPA